MAINILSNHFLQIFSDSGEPFAVLRDRLYTLNKTNGNFNGQDAFHFLNKAYTLDESEKISRLEEYFFNANRTYLEQIMSNSIRANQKLVDSKKHELQQTQNYYAQLQDTSIEKFIMIDVFNEYNHEGRAIDSEIQTNQWDNLPKIDRYPGIEDLIDKKKNSLNPLIENNGFIVFGKKCHILCENGGQKDENQGYVVFRKKIFDVKSWVPLSEICNKYTQQLVNRVQQKANEHGKQFVDILIQMDNEKTKLAEVLKQREVISGKTQDSRGEISFKKIKDGEYEISVTVPPYIIEKNGEYHAFGTAKIGTIIKAKNNEIMVEHSPRVLNMPYVHPFVFSSQDNYARIGFGKLNWQQKRGMTYNQNYSISSPENKKKIAKIIAEVMREGKKTLERGYVGTPGVNFNPVRQIEDCECKIANSRNDAERYARGQRIAVERIIKND